MMALCLAAGCKDDGGDAPADGSTSDDDTAGDADPTDASADDPTDASAEAEDADPTDASADDPDTADPDTDDPDTSGDEDPDTGEPGEPIYDESFDGPDGDPWPSPWTIVGTHVLDAALDGGRARMSGANNLVARLVLEGFDERDVEVEAVVEYDDWNAQGYGFYVRQNGGALQETDPPGQGYGVYAEGGYMRSLGVWKEIDGVETEVLTVPDAVPGGVAAGVPYRIRFQCRQVGDNTLLRAKMWRDGDPEPGDWMVETEDDTPELQGISGSFANDVYNYAGSGPVWVHHVTIRPL
jgi:hypothetical protein